MQENELILRPELKTMPIEKLRTILNEEIAKDVPDDDLVLAIVHMLEERDPVNPEPETDRETAAFKTFKQRVHSRRKRKLPISGSFLKVASMVLAVCLLFSLVPQQAQADNWWDRLTRWTDDFFGFFREEETIQLETYEFQTENPGLQRVYDAVVELGVTIPAVPMWLPEGFELAECTTVTNPHKQYVHSRFLNDDQECILKITVLRTEDAKIYYKNGTDIEEYEKGGMVHGLVQNVEVWTVSWAKDNIECSIFIDCPEDDLYKIIDSIYRWRMNE